MMIVFVVEELTLDDENDPLADGGGDAVLRDAKVRAHLSPRDPDEVQHLAVDHVFL